ncbi:CDGSH iron-sulfur domain-containing protein [Streptomyces sp. NPDC006975]|uniref:CDGSH iron-sulfur domain-containing protein n=1 Tax=Streptomyces sp. NPDC006975 TaxID=3154310 RepID=UPI003454C796
MKVQRRGPLLVEGPVEVELEDGTTVSSDRFRVALCTCRRSRRYPWCDTSHRRTARPARPREDEASARPGEDKTSARPGEDETSARPGEDRASGGSEAP